MRKRKRLVRPRASTEHKTRVKLLEGAISLINLYDIDEITSDMVLAHTEISRGSLYHHFNNFDELMGEAVIARLAKASDRLIKNFDDALAKAKNIDAFSKILIDILVGNQLDEQRVMRMNFAKIIVKSKSNMHLSDLLSIHQQKFTSNIKIIFENYKSKGFINNKVDPYSASIIFQSIMFGKIIEDISGNKGNFEGFDYIFTKSINRVLCDDN